MSKDAKPPEKKPEPEAIRPQVPKHRQCPLCYGAQGGIGTAFHTRGRTRYYKCGSCSHSWKATLVDLEITQPEPENLETR